MRVRVWNVVAVVTLGLIVVCGPTLLAQAAATAQAVAGVPPTGPSDSSEALGALVWAFMSSSALEWLKRNRTLTIFSERTSWVAQRGIGAALALGTAAGIHFSFDSHAGTLVITGLIWASVANAGFDALRQWVFQEFMYRTAIKNYGVKPV